MIDTNLLLNLGNIVMFIGTLLLIRVVIKDRNVLRGYDPIGSFLSFLGMAFFDAFYVEINNQFSLWIALVTTAYWFLVSICTIRNVVQKHFSR
jgi:hypothetical protein